jgi:hypothetical protein
MPPKPQTINLDRIRLSGPWAAWWAIFSVAVLGVWYLRGTKDAGEAVVVEVKAMREEMRAATEMIHILDVRVSTLEEWKRSKAETGKNW